MIFKVIVLLLLSVYNVRSQAVSTFGPLSSSGLGLTTTTSFSTLATASTTASSSIVPCPSTSNVCKNGGQCFILNNRDFFCSCPIGFTGIFCETASFVTTAATTTTTLTTASPIQICPVGFNFCENNGQCFVLNGVDLLCVCQPGFTGSRCELSLIATTTTTTTIASVLTSTTAPPVQPCPAGINICQNGGQCIILNGAQIVCSCLVGFTGQNCEFPITTTTPLTNPTTTLTTTTVPQISPCPAGINVCQNGGQCLILNGVQFLCSCVGGFTGSNCEIPPLTTTTTPIPATTATTVTTSTTATTTTFPPVVLCPAGVTVCQNGGACLIINGAQVVCSCVGGFSGANCEIPPLTTTTTPIPTITTTMPTTTTTVTTTTFPPVALCPAGVTVCQNGGACLILNGVQLVCSCVGGFTGTNCEIPPTTTTTTTTPIPTTTTTTLPTTTTTETTTTFPPIALCPAGVTVCQNGGQCLIINGAQVVCSCVGGFTGLNCEISPPTMTTPIPSTTTTTEPVITSCTPNPCQNDHICVFKAAENQGVCLCTQAYTGKFCEIVL